MDTTIRNLDDRLYRRLKARAALEGRTIGELVNEAIRGYLGTPDRSEDDVSLADLEPVPYPDGCDELSREVDAVVYGA